MLKLIFISSKKFSTKKEMFATQVQLQWARLRTLLCSFAPMTQSRSKQLESESLQKELPLGLRLQFSGMALLIQPDFICLPPALERYNVFYFLNICIERRGTTSYSQHHRHFNHLDTQVSFRVVHFHRVSSEVVHS